MLERILDPISGYAALLSLVMMFGPAAVAVRADPRPADFGTQWVRQHPLTIMGADYGTAPWSFDFNLYLGMNLNTVFANNAPAIAQAAANAGVAWHGSGYVTGVARPYPQYTTSNKMLINQLIAQGHITAWNVADEPDINELQNVAVNTQWMRENHPELLNYITVPGGQTTTLLQSAITTIKPDLLMFDAYPFYDSGDVSSWFSDLMTVRQVSLANHIPYGGWLQSFHLPGVTLRTPSESDTRYNGFTLLTAGYKMLNYFMYDHGSAGAGSTSTFFDANGTPTATYHQAALANAEYAKVGQSLRYLTSTDVRFVPGRHTVFGPITAQNSTPDGLIDLEDAPVNDPHLLSATVGDNQLGSAKNGLIGFFTDDDNNHYFMLTNLNHGGNLSAADATLSFSVKFDSTVNSIWLFNRLTGQSQEIALSSEHVLTWTLPGGTGDLFKYDNGNFAGVPEPSGLALMGLGSLAILFRNRHAAY